jgi:hypothetical protein
MTIKKTTLSLMVLAIIVGVSLFIINYQVQGSEDELKEINRNIDLEKTALHVLRAEWSHLNEPNRLRELVTRHLNLVPLMPEQFISENKINIVLKKPLQLEKNETKVKNNKTAFEGRMKQAIRGVKSE